MRDPVPSPPPVASGPVARLPLHEFLEACQAWLEEPTGVRGAAARTAVGPLLVALGIDGLYLEVDVPGRPSLRLGSGTLRRRPSRRRPALLRLPLRGDGGSVALGRLTADLGGSGQPLPGRARLHEVAQVIELVLEVDRTRREARRTAARADALDAATRAIAGVFDREGILQLIVDRVRTLARAEYAALGTVDREGQIDHFYTSGISAVQRERIGPVPRGLGLLGVIIREGRSFLVPDIATDPRHVGFPPGHPEMHGFIGVPITVRGRSVGNLYLTNPHAGGSFTVADLETVEAFARHAGIAIDNAGLRERIGQLAIVEERERIGRDLHDGIIQGIYAVALSLEEAVEIVETEPDEARLRVDRAIEALNLTIRDIRNFIFGLRPELLEQAGLLGGLAALADEFRLNTLVEVELDIIESEGFEPSPEVTHELLAIAREALSNVARHARATRATIAVRALAGGYGLTVSDNGVGFQVRKALGPGHQGLRNMRERAVKLGGSLEIESAPGRGTRIILSVSPPPGDEQR
ncbi:MAG: GAF domain-containing sensor histidine kinase [Candidatus Limnocylindrales bacterium]